MKKMILFVAMMGVLIVTAFGQRGQGYGQGRHKGPGQGFRSGNFEQMKPVINEQRKKLDDVLSKEDKTKVAEIRKSIKDNQLACNKLRYEIREKHILGETDEALVEKLGEQQAEMGKIHQEALLLANKYLDDIKPLMGNIRDLSPQGGQRGPGMAPQGFGGHGQMAPQGFGGRGHGQCNNACGRGRGQGPDNGPGFGRNGGFHRGFNNPNHPVGFLLWDSK